MIDVYCVGWSSPPAREEQLVEPLLEQPPAFARGHHSLRVLWIQLQGFLGPGLLLVPCVVRRTNMLLGVAALLLVYLIYGYCFSVLARCAEYTQTYAYAELPLRVGARRTDMLPVYHPDPRDTSLIGHWFAALVNLTRFAWATGVGAVAVLYISGTLSTFVALDPTLLIIVVCAAALLVLNFSVSYTRTKRLNGTANVLILIGFGTVAALMLWTEWKRDIQPHHLVTYAQNVTANPLATLGQHFTGWEDSVESYWAAVCTELRRLLSVITGDLKAAVVNMGVLFLALDAVYQLLPTKTLLSEPNQFRTVAFTTQTAVVVICLIGTSVLPAEPWLTLPAQRWLKEPLRTPLADYARWLTKGCFALGLLFKLPLLIAPAADLLVTNQLSTMQVSRRLSSGSHTLIINDEIQDVVTSRSSNQHGQRCAGCRQYHQRVCQFARGCELLVIACVISFSRLPVLELAAAVGLFCSVPLVVLYPALLRLALRPDPVGYSRWNPALYIPPALLDTLVVLITPALLVAATRPFAGP